MDYKEIIIQLKKQDQKGLELLYNQYGTKLYGYAVKKWYLEDYAWDIVYKTLYKLIEVLPRHEFESQSKFDHFIIKVFINFLKEHYRNNKYPTERVFEDSNTYIPEENHEDNDEALEKIDNDAIWIEPEVLKDYYEHYENPKLEKLKRALAKLEESDREMLLLKSQNFDYDEIATMLKIEKKLLKVKYFRAKERLIKLFNSLNA